MTTYIAYGNGDKRERLGFPTLEEFLKYIREDIFTVNRCRYRYSQNREADIIVLTRDAKAYGHFEIEKSEDPNAEDIADYPDVTKVYVVQKSALYKNEVRLFDLGIRNVQTGVDFGPDKFAEILKAAGGVEEFPRIETKYCRLCFNNDNWWQPTGSAVEGDTYYGKNKFGHEEWLFRYDWCLNGIKYGFLQPVNLYLKNNQGRTFSLILYTKHEGKNLFVGKIRKVYVPHDDELAAAYQQFEANGWLNLMRSEVDKVGGNVSALGNNVPNLVLNVRFDPADVGLNDDITNLPVFPIGQKPTRAPYYNLYDDEGEPLPAATEPTNKSKLPITRRKELQYERAAQEKTTVNPLHAQIQNRLYDWLCKQHGPGVVGFEIKAVDLRVTLPERVTFFEIKTAATAKQCIREAFGQLSEYSEYPTDPKADRWVVVSIQSPTENDLAYLKHLRTKFNLPVYYARFDEATGALDEPR